MTDIKTTNSPSVTLIKNKSGVTAIVYVTAARNRGVVLSVSTAVVPSGMAVVFCVEGNLTVTDNAEAIAESIMHSEVGNVHEFHTSYRPVMNSSTA